MNRPLSISVISIAIFLCACQNQKEKFFTEAVADYLPLQIGKYITYRLDSTVFTQSGSKIETHQYLVKHTVQSETTDNEGRKTFVINRQLNNVTGSGAWVANGSYYITPLTDRMEVVDNNLRVVTLRSPLKTGFTWKGNSYLPLAPYKPLYKSETAGIQMNQWEFQYGSMADTSINNIAYKNVWTVVQSNEVNNIPPTPATSFGFIEVSQEKYAKGIGLIYKNFQLYDYQAAHADNPQASYAGFGITMWIVEHN